MCAAWHGCQRSAARAELAEANPCWPRGAEGSKYPKSMNAGAAIFEVLAMPRHRQSRRIPMISLIATPREMEITRAQVTRFASVRRNRQTIDIASAHDRLPRGAGGRQDRRAPTSSVLSTND